MRIQSGLGAGGWRAIDTPGSYEWWYLDAVSADGRLALVTILFASFPFSPDYLTDFERGREPHPLEHVAVFTALYHDGNQISYALDRYDRSAFSADRTEPNVTIGPNRLRLETHADRPRLRLTLDLPSLVGGLRMVGGAHVAGELVFDVNHGAEGLDSAGGDPHHVWNPIAPGCSVSGEITLRLPGGEIGYEGAFEGRGYVDHNWGSKPLTQGIERWHWGRAHLSSSTLVYYATEFEGGATENLLAVSDERGARAAVASFEAADWTRRMLCPRYPRTFRASAFDGEARVELTGTVRDVVDWGPFYMRFLTDFEARTAGGHVERAVGISEYLAPRGLRAKIFRPLIKTRIRRVL